MLSSVPGAGAGPESARGHHAEEAVDVQQLRGDERVGGALLLVLRREEPAPAGRGPPRRGPQGALARWPGRIDWPWSHKTACQNGRPYIRAFVKWRVLSMRSTPWG